MYKRDIKIKTKLSQDEIKNKLYNISIKKSRFSLFFMPNEQKFL